MPDTESRSDVTALTVELLSAYLANNTVASGDLADLIRTTRSALTDDPSPAPVVEETHVPAVTSRKSLASPEHILSLIDGKPYKTLKRHLARHGLTPDTYRERYNLSANYPMVAPSFAAKRREIARKIGLGARRAPEAAKAETAQSIPATEGLEAGLPGAKVRRKLAKPGKPKAASVTRSGRKAVADTAATVVVPQRQAENEKLDAAKSRTALKRAPVSGKKGTRSAAQAKPDTAAESVPTEKPRPTRRARLGLFGGGAAEPAGNGVVNADVASIAGSETKTALNAPRAKRMARTLATSSPK